MADTAQELVLRGVELEQLGVLRLDLREQLGVSHGDGDMVGEQVQQVLVGSFPAAGGGQPAEQHAEDVAARAQDRSQRPGFTRDGVLDRDGRWVAEIDRGVDHPERDHGVVRRARGQEVDAVAWRDRFDRGEDPAQLTVPPLEVRREAIVALGELRELVVAGHPDRGREVAG